MAPLNLDLRTFDVGAQASTPEEFSALVIQQTLDSWENGADIVVFPEFTWMGLEKFVKGPDNLSGIASLFWETLWPELASRLSREDKAAVLGSVPFRETDGTVKNRAPILSEGRILHQDKIHLTPWESSFSGGGPLQIWRFREFKIAVVICLDVEIPEISVALRGLGLDLMIVPSATDNLSGVCRVGRCADARSVELGCYVGVCHLVGLTESELIDENVGRLAVYSPSQSPFLAVAPRDESPVHRDGFHCKSVSLDMRALEISRSLRGETDPSKVIPCISGIPIKLS